MQISLQFGRLTAVKTREKSKKITYGCNERSNERPQVEVIEQEVPASSEYGNRSNDIANG